MLTNNFASSAKICGLITRTEAGRTNQPCSNTTVPQKGAVSFKQCPKCRVRAWQRIDSYTIGCDACGFSIPAISKRAIAITTGKPCPKCSQSMVRRQHPPTWSPSPHQAYYFEFWDICPTCQHVQHYEAAKRSLSQFHLQPQPTHASVNVSLIDANRGGRSTPVAIPTLHGEEPIARSLR